MCGLGKVHGRTFYTSSHFQIPTLHQHLSQYRCIQIIWYQSSLTLHTAITGRLQPLLGSGQNSQATLYLFQKYLLCWEHEYIVSWSKITSVKGFWHSTSFQCLKETAHSCEFRGSVFETDRKQVELCVLWLPRPAYVLTPTLSRIKLFDEDNRSHYSVWSCISKPWICDYTFLSYYLVLEVCDFHTSSLQPLAFINKISYTYALTAKIIQKFQQS